MGRTTGNRVYFATFQVAPHVVNAQPGVRFPGSLTLR